MLKINHFIFIEKMKLITLSILLFVLIKPVFAIDDTESANLSTTPTPTASPTVTPVPSVSPSPQSSPTPTATPAPSTSPATQVSPSPSTTTVQESNIGGNSEKKTDVLGSTSVLGATGTEKDLFKWILAVLITLIVFIFGIKIVRNVTDFNGQE